MIDLIRELTDLNWISNALIVCKGWSEVVKYSAKAKVVILGLTFKEHTPDTRNSKVEDIINRLKEYNINPSIVDPWANENDALREYNVELTDIKEVADADCLIFAVGHDEFKNLSNNEIDSFFKTELRNDERIIIDVKSLLEKVYFEENGYVYWRL